MNDARLKRDGSDAVVAGLMSTVVGKPGTLKGIGYGAATVKKAGGVAVTVE